MYRSNNNTQRYLTDAGIVEGMRVLELGCGNGEVTAEIAKLVGRKGVVIAVDKNKAILDSVRTSFFHHLKEQTIFLELDITDSLEKLHAYSEKPFDAIVCRRLLMYLDSPAKTLEKFAPFVKKYGIILVEEVDMSMVPHSAFDSPSRDKAVNWIKKMLTKEGANLKIGLQLPYILGDAGFDVKRLGAEAVIEGQAIQFPLHQMLELIAHRLESASIASPIEVNETIQNLKAESDEIDNAYISAMSFYAYGYKI